MIDYLDTIDVCRLLSKACKDAGGQRAWAEIHDMSPSYVSNVLHARCEPGKAMLDALGLARVVLYYKRPEAITCPS